MGFPIQLAVVGGVLVLIAAVYIRLYNRLRRLWVKVEEGSADIDVALEKRFDLLSEQIEAVKKFLKHEAELYTSVAEIRSGTRSEERRLGRQEQLTQEALREADRQVLEQAEAMERIRERMEQSRRSGGHSAKSQRRQAKREEEMRQRTEKRDLASGQKIGLLADINRSLLHVGSGIDALAENYPALYSTNSMQQFQRAISDAEEHLQAARRLYNANASLYNQARAMFPTSAIAALHGMDAADFYEVEDQKRSFRVDFD